MALREFNPARGPINLETISVRVLFLKQKFEKLDNFLEAKIWGKKNLRRKLGRVFVSSQDSVIQTRHKANTHYQTSVDEGPGVDIAPRYKTWGTTANRAQRR